MTNFVAHGPGVVPRYPSDNFNIDFSHWNVIADWCYQQGWELNKDFLQNASIPNGAWYFSTMEQQSFFALRWA